MSRKYRKIDKIMLTILLFTISGAILAYNLHTTGGGTLAVSLTELNSLIRPTASAVSDSAAANLLARDSIFTSANPAPPPREYPLLEPIVRAP